jgi:hypothetical protein
VRRICAAMATAQGPMNAAPNSIITSPIRKAVSFDW